MICLEDFVVTDAVNDVLELLRQVILLVIPKRDQEVANSVRSARYLHLNVINSAYHLI